MANKKKIKVDSFIENNITDSLKEESVLKKEESKSSKYVYVVYVGAAITRNVFNYIFKNNEPLKMLSEEAKNIINKYGNQFKIIEEIKEK